jgi:hypothetical protein
MNTLLRQSLIALAWLSCSACALARDNNAACTITAQGVADINLGDTFENFKATHADHFRIAVDTDLATQVVVFDSAQARASENFDVNQVSFLVYFEGHGVGAWPMDPPKDGQKIDRIEVHRKDCRTGEGLHPGMLLKDAVRRHGGLQHIEVTQHLGDKLLFDQPPEGLVFYVTGSVVKRSPDRETWTTRRYRPDARIFAIAIVPAAR